MADTLRGKLTRILGRDKKSAWRIAWTTKKGKSQNDPPRAGALSADLLNASEQEIEVEYDFSADGSYPMRIRRVGMPWVASAMPVTSGRRPSPAGRRGERVAATGSTKSAAAHQRHFHNPYNFIPAPEPKPDKELGDLGQRAPVGHGAWYPDHISGQLTVDITVKTPLLVPDASRATKKDGHTTLPLLTENDDGETPKLPVTSFKGALRSAYEAITNSRLAVFPSHDKPLGRRMDTNEGLAMVPARIRDDGRLELWMGTLNPRNEAEYARNRPQADRRPPVNTMYAAWLPHYDTQGSSPKGPVYDKRNAIRFPDGEYPTHGKLVVCWLRKAQKIARTGNPIFSYWRVEAIRPGHDLSALPPESALGLPETEFGNSHRLVAGERPIRAKGYVSITNQNIGRKHDERVFFVPEGQEPYLLPVEQTDLDTWGTAWTYLVDDYIAKAETIIAKRKDRGMALNAFESQSIGETALSRHICNPKAKKLQPGDLCFANVAPSGSITGLFPVMISREVARLSPLHLLPESLRPAESLIKLSPADRVFGWVDQSGGKKPRDEKRAYKGQLRIASLQYIDCTNEAGAETKPITRFEGDGLPLAILSAPKPEQARFYVAKDKQGTPQEDGWKKFQVAYDHEMTGPGQSNKSLRGRKVFPHHRDLPDDYWDGSAAAQLAHDSPNQNQPVGDRFREYVRLAQDKEEPGNVVKNRDALRDDQNRSIGGWVNPGARFRAKIDVTNLTAVELGALLYLVDLPDDHYFRLGSGKPLGFGSVRVSLVGLDLSDGEAIRNDLLALLPRAHETSGWHSADARAARDRFTQAYKDAMEDIYGREGGFDDISMIKAFRIAAQGFPDGKPIHYPRAAASEWNGTSPVPPSPEGENFKWFGENERSSGPRHALDPLWQPTGLTMLSVKEDERKTRPRDGGRGSGSRTHRRQR